MTDHLGHLEKVFTRLRENELYVKPSKCSFAQTSISFLGHIVGQGNICMDPKKIQAIQEWRPPSNVTELRSFLGLANYYRRFIKDYSKIALPLTDLLKKSEAWHWLPQCQLAFEKMKSVISSNPVLALPEVSEPFEVHTDASDFALGGVLVQRGHPVAFESRKLSEVERRYPAHEKELLAVVHCLRVWRHYLLGSQFVVKTDNTAVSYFLSQPKLSSKQARWQAFLAEFDMTFEYRKGTTNHVADALSRRPELARIAPLSGSQVSTPIRDRIRESLVGDSVAQQLLRLVEQGKSRQFWLEEGLLMTKGRRLYVPKVGDLRRTLLKECHDTPWAGHPGNERTLALVQQGYYWPQMRDDVEEFMKTCLIC